MLSGGSVEALELKKMEIERYLRNGYCHILRDQSQIDNYDWSLKDWLVVLSPKEDICIPNSTNNILLQDTHVDLRGYNRYIVSVGGTTVLYVFSGCVNSFNNSIIVDFERGSYVNLYDNSLYIKMGSIGFSAISYKSSFDGEFSFNGWDESQSLGSMEDMRVTVVEEFRARLKRQFVTYHSVILEQLYEF